MFEPGSYYVGDPGFILPNDDLRTIFSGFMNGKIKPGLRELVASRIITTKGMDRDFYWIALTPNKSGTLYDQENKGFGFEWGVFGVVPWKWVENKGAHLGHKFEFTQPFNCSFDDEGISIGNLYFSYKPK